MTKEKLIQENQELRNRIATLEKENAETGISYECNRLYAMNNILKDQINFYEKILINLTSKNKEEENEYN